MKVKKVLLWSGAALAIFFLVTQPEGAASLVNQTLSTLQMAAEALITFVRSVFSA
jgi:hypothetical protein